ncbi:MAG: hypothetical protein Kow00107_06300 [Planctomycetota bacterium]
MTELEHLDTENVYKSAQLRVVGIQIGCKGYFNPPPVVKPTFPQPLRGDEGSIESANADSLIISRPIRDLSGRAQFG